MHISRIVAHDIFERMIFLALSKSIDNKKEALWVICNCITGSDSQLKTLIITKYNALEIIAALIQGTFM
jgi:hypothetical protein